MHLERRQSPQIHRARDLEAGSGLTVPHPGSADNPIVRLTYHARRWGVLLAQIARQRASIERKTAMSSSTIASRLSATALLAVLLTAASACGDQTAADIAPAPPGAGPSAEPKAQSPRATDADARRAAQGQLPSPSPAPPGKRLPDARP
jgi:hypothetical protein